MTEINEIKRSIREQLKNCEDQRLLLDILVKLAPHPPNLSGINYVSEPKTAYGSVSSVPQVHHELLKKDRELFKNGEIEAKPMKELMSRLRQKYDSASFMIPKKWIGKQLF